MNNSIDRQRAIDAINQYYKDKKYITRSRTILSAICQDMKNIMGSLPSAEPEQKTGKWIRNDNGTYSCGLCHSWLPEEQYHYARFCLYCGAKMEEDDERPY